MTIHRAGAAASASPAFEITRPADGELSYLVSFDQKAGALSLGSGENRSAVIAEIELTAAGGFTAGFDPSVTLMSDATGRRSATVAGGTLMLSGTASGTPRPAPKQPPTND